MNTTATATQPAPRDPLANAYRQDGTADGDTNRRVQEIAQDGIDYLGEELARTAPAVVAAGAIEVHEDAGWINFAGDKQRADFTDRVTRKVRSLMAAGNPDGSEI